MGESPRCRICGKKAAAYVQYLGFHLCRDHFVEFFERRVWRTVERFRMIRRGETVAVAVSGGKDSLALLHVLAEKAEEKNIQIIGVAVDEGIRGYREFKLKALEDFARDRGVDIVVGSFKEYVGATLDEMVVRLREMGFEYKPCSVCGVFRRYVLNRVAREVGADKLATGHNLDDETQVFLMNFLRGSAVNIAKEGVWGGLFDLKGFVRRIKPFYLIPEKEVLLYSLFQGIETPFVECPYIIYAVRHVVRRWLNSVEDAYPGSKYRVAVMKHLIANILAKNLDFRPRRCRICGEPSSREICRACFFRQYLSLPLPSGRVH